MKQCRTFKEFLNKKKKKVSKPLESKYKSNQAIRKDNRNGERNNPLVLLKNVQKSYDKFWNDVQILAKSLEGRGQSRIAKEIKNGYTNSVVSFNKMVSEKMRGVRKIKEVKNLEATKSPLQTIANKFKKSPIVKSNRNRLFNGIQGKKGYTNKK